MKRGKGFQQGEDTLPHHERQPVAGCLHHAKIPINRLVAGCLHPATVAILIVILSASSLTVFAAKPDPEREAAFDLVVKSYEAKNWEETTLLIDRFLNKYPHSDHEASLLMLSAESNVKLRKLEKADALASQVILQFPEMKHIGRARLTLGESALLAGDWEKGELNLSWVVSFSDDQSAIAVARERLGELHAFLKMQEKASQPFGVADSCPPNLKVALILPMTGALANDAQNFLTGFRSCWNTSSLPDPLLFDSENNSVKAVRLFGEVAREYHPWVVVGGFSVSDATGLAAYSQSIRVPFLTTTCGDDGLASVSSFAIQGRADYGGLGAALGRFAALNMGLHNLAIFYVDNISGRRMAVEFREQAELNGSKIQAEVAFYPGTIDYSKNLLQLKSSFLRQNFDDSLNAEYTTYGRLFLSDAIYVPQGKDVNRQEIPSNDDGAMAGGVSLSSKFLDSLWFSDHRTRRWTNESSQDIDSAAIELPNLDGIFVVIEPGTIEMIAPQLTRYRLNHQLFGNECWDDRDALRKVQSYINGIVFVNPLASANDSALLTMTSIAISQGEKSASRYHFAGERAARIVEEAVKRSKSPEGFRDAITTLNAIPTMSGKVTFVKEERVARSQSLILFKDGSFITVGE